MLTWDRVFLRPNDLTILFTIACFVWAMRHTGHGAVQTVVVLAPTIFVVWHVILIFAYWGA